MLGKCKGSVSELPFKHLPGWVSGDVRGFLPMLEICAKNDEKTLELWRFSEGQMARKYLMAFQYSGLSIYFVMTN